MKLKDACFLGRKVMSNLDSIFKSRDITFPTKVHLAKTMVFPVVMCGCENWTVKKAEHGIDAFELWCWRRLLRVPWTARRSNQSILKEISPGCSLEGMRLKLKLQYFGHLMRRVDSLEKTLTLGEIGGRRRRGWQRMRWQEWTSGVRDGQGGLACCDSWGHKESDMTERLNWTDDDVCFDSDHGQVCGLGAALLSLSHCFPWIHNWYVYVLVAQLCPVFCYPMYTPWVEAILGPEMWIHTAELVLPFSTWGHEHVCLQW